MNLREELKEYDAAIKKGKIALDENYTCKLCKEEFYYRPFSCRIICNDCLQNEEFITILGFIVKLDGEEE